jgi:RNA polymerase sigma factor (sigma-70 family)
MQDEMTDSASQTTQLDQSAVTAVRGGDAERYRELVERHERRVYAVAWSRLGDAALAEEVTQEAFIRAYRRLWLLGDGAKFSGWINTIARRVAINFGLRHRRELNKRERWALENYSEAAAENSPTENESLHSPETLRQTLAELPAHRECLVLFYLEGKSGAEAAAALGISESALRVRLHRARAALRERLEEKLEGSLTKLRPAKTLVPAVMASVLASSKVATSGGTALLGVLVKLSPFKWLLPFFAAGLGALPTLAMSAAAARAEQRNYREPEGFRAQMSRVMHRRILWVVPLTVIPMVGGILMLMSKLGQNTTHVILAVFMIGIFVLFWMTQHNRFQNGMMIWYAMLAGGMVLIATGLISPDTYTLIFVAANVWLMQVVKKQPRRMDTSLFFRAGLGMLELPADISTTNILASRLGKSDLMHFARFLGDRWLVNDYRWLPEGLLLRQRFVRPMNINKAGLVPFLVHRDSSNLLLAWNGDVTAQQLEKNDPRPNADAAARQVQLESQVATAVKFAWQSFRAGNISAAEKAIGEKPESDIFLVPPARAASTRWQQASLALVVVMFSVMIVLGRLPKIIEAVKVLFPR